MLYYVNRLFTFGFHAEESEDEIISSPQDEYTPMEKLARIAIKYNVRDGAVKEMSALLREAG